MEKKKFFIVITTFVFLHLIICFLQLGAELAILVQDVSINADFQLLGKGVKRHASAPNYFVTTSLGVMFLQVCNKFF